MITEQAAVPFDHWDSTDLNRWPLFKRALESATPAYSVIVNWLVGRSVIWQNYTQIVRTPFDPENGMRHAFNDHLGEIEEILLNGIPVFTEKNGVPFHTCGGARHFLGRNPRDDDRIELKLLRKTVLLTNRQKPGDPREDEWVTEFSLVVVPA